MGHDWFDLVGVPPRRARAGNEEEPGRARRTRDALLVAAAVRFAGHGYHRTTLRDVLADTGLTKGALYFHFGSKLALAQAVCLRADEAWEDLVEVIAARGLDPLQEMLVQSDATFTQLTRDVSLAAALRIGGEAEELSGLLGAWRHQWEARTTELLERARARGLLRTWVEPEALARLVVAMMLGHMSYVPELAAYGFDPWARLSGSWDDVLGVVATPAWLEGWRASGWHERPRPQ